MTTSRSINSWVYGLCTGLDDALPEELWSELAELLPAEENWLDS